MTVTNTPPAVDLAGVEKRFGDLVAVRHLDLQIEPGEFFSIIGPSGCGKTTTLRMIAGFEDPTAGRISVSGKDVTGVRPYRRPVNTVFQSYALFPHLDVFENVAFGLREARVGKAEVRARVAEAISLVQLEGRERSRPRKLSGGQQQRVALARALVNRPDVLLLDEPLGALDLKLREDMQLELKQIQQQVGITFIYVTHDQGEALTMSDRMAVFNRGRVEQIGAPADVYERPATQFVAGFVGTSNLLTGQVALAVVGEEGTYTVRPEKIRMAGPDEAPTDGQVAARGHIRKVVYLGSDTRFLVALDAGGELTVTQQNLVTESTEALELEGKPVTLLWQRQHTLPVSEPGGQAPEEEGDLPQ